MELTGNLSLTLSIQLYAEKFCLSKLMSKIAEFKGLKGNLFVNDMRGKIEKKVP